MFKDAKVGDRVWHIRYGFGKITEICPQYVQQIIVDFGIAKKSFSYAGKEWEGDLNPTLFWDEIKFDIPTKPLPKLKIDTQVLVWDNTDEQKLKRYFSHFDKDGDIVVFCSGGTSWSYGGFTVAYENWELYNETND